MKNATCFTLITTVIIQIQRHARFMTTETQLSYGNGMKPRVERGNTLYAWHCPTLRIKHALLRTFLKHERSPNQAVKLFLHVTQTHLTTITVIYSCIYIYICQSYLLTVVSNFPCNRATMTNSLKPYPDRKPYTFTSKSVLRQVHRPFHSEFSAECDLVLPNNDY
jgi:hypothetical protein